MFMICNQFFMDNSICTNIGHKHYLRSLAEVITFMPDIDIIIHFPKKQEDIYILQKKIALIHAEAVIKHIEKTSCPKEQKMALLTAVKKGVLADHLTGR